MIAEKKMIGVTSNDDQDKPKVLRDLDHINRRPRLEPPPRQQVEPMITAVEDPHPNTEQERATEEEIEELVPEFMRKDFYRSQEMDSIPNSIEIQPKKSIKPTPAPTPMPEAPVDPEPEAEPETEEEAEVSAPLWKWLGLMFVVLAIFFMGDYLASDLAEPQPEFTGVPLNQVADPVASPSPVATVVEPSNEEPIPPPVSDPEPAPTQSSTPDVTEPAPEPPHLPVSVIPAHPEQPPSSDLVPDRPWRVADPAPPPSQPAPNIEYVLPEPPL